MAFMLFRPASFGRALFLEVGLMKAFNLRKIAVCAIFSALGFALMMLEFPLPFIIPSFIKLDFSEIPALIAAYAFGPIYGIIVCAVKNLLHLFVTTSAGVGELSNFVLGAVFCGMAGLAYKKNHSRKGALIGALIGAAAMAVISVATNYFVVYPAYVVIYGMPMEAILGMYKALLPMSDNLFKALLIFNLPFNLAKGIIDAAVCFAVYKRISPILKNENP